MTDADFERVRKLIYQRAGIVLAEHKREMVYSRLARRLRQHHLTRFADYLARLENKSDSQEWESFTNALTTNLTAFFREAHHFPLLASHVAKRSGPIRIWCAAASTGEEPYSIAMQLSETLGSRAKDARILATDIDTDALAKAREAVYPIDQVAKLDEARRKQFFLRGSGARSGQARIRPEIAAMVEFKPLNLLAPKWPIEGPFDAIFCRNVMIYFDKVTQSKILEGFVPFLKSDGLLFAGHSENFSFISQAFRLRGQTVYELANIASRQSSFGR
ncbi:CheR family methyltransferase [Halomonas sp. GXIMD04776]|uniref:CheR family methyltransferase n=1 Tax=Halomonas sp. GXIMD04776 TaxID=3415605 RepID=UPI003CAEFE71